MRRDLRLVFVALLTVLATVLAATVEWRLPFPLWPYFALAAGPAWLAATGEVDWFDGKEWMGSTLGRWRCRLCDVEAVVTVGPHAEGYLCIESRTAGIAGSLVPAIWQALTDSEHWATSKPAPVESEVPRTRDQVEVLKHGLGLASLSYVPFATLLVAGDAFAGWVGGGALVALLGGGAAFAADLARSGRLRFVPSGLSAPGSLRPWGGLTRIRHGWFMPWRVRLHFGDDVVVANLTLDRHRVALISAIRGWSGGRTAGSPEDAAAHRAADRSDEAPAKRSLNSHQFGPGARARRPDARALLLIGFGALVAGCSITNLRASNDPDAGADAHTEREEDAGARTDAAFTRDGAIEPEPDAYEPPDATFDGNVDDVLRFSRMDETGYCASERECVCYEDGWGACEGTDDVCIPLDTLTRCGSCENDCTVSYRCPASGRACSCIDRVCQPSTLIDFWPPSVGLFEPGFIEHFNFPHLRSDRRASFVGPGGRSWAAVLIDDDGRVYLGSNRDGLPPWTNRGLPFDAVRAHVGPGGGTIVTTDGYLVVTNADLIPQWRAPGLEGVVEACSLSDEAFYARVGGTVLSYGTNPNLLGLGGEVTPYRTFVPIGLPLPAVSMACLTYATARAALFVLEDGSLWMTGERNLVHHEVGLGTALAPERVVLPVVIRVEAAIWSQYDDWYCLRSPDVAGGYWCRGERARGGATPWEDVPAPREVREGYGGVCGLFDDGPGEVSIRCITGPDVMHRAVTVWANHRG